MTTQTNLTQADYERILSGDSITNDRFRRLIEQVISQGIVTEGSGVPTQVGIKHQWYFDAATSKYYRNTDGGTTWVALN